MSATKKTTIKCAHCFKSLGVASRIEIYNFLVKKGKATVSEVVNFIKLKQPTISYHLKEMKENGLLESEKKGKEVFYSVTAECPHFDEPCVISQLNFPRELRKKRVKTHA